MKTIIFDFDGTIADTFPVVLDIFHRVSKRETQLKLEETAIFRRVAYGQVKGRVILKHAGELKVPWWRLPFLFAAIKLILKGRMGEALPMPGMLEAIKSFHGRGYNLMIVSANSKGNIQKWLRKENLSNCFTKIYGSVRSGGKTEILTKIESRYKKTGGDFWLISDEGRDIKSAHQAGMKSVAVTWGYNDRKQLEEESPTEIVGQAEKLLKVLGAKAK